MRNKIAFAMLLAGLGLGKVSGAPMPTDTPSPKQPWISWGGRPSRSSSFPVLETFRRTPKASAFGMSLLQGAFGFVGMTGLLTCIFSLKVRSNIKSRVGRVIAGSCFLLGACGYAITLDAMAGAAVPMDKTRVKEILDMYLRGCLVAIGAGAATKFFRRPSPEVGY